MRSNVAYTEKSDDFFGVFVASYARWRSHGLTAGGSPAMNGAPLTRGVSPVRCPAHTRRTAALPPVDLLSPMEKSP